VDTVAGKVETNGKGKRELSMDMPIWEQQPEESTLAYEAFKNYLDDETRRVASHGATAWNWSSEWQWGRRAYEFDKYMMTVDLQDQIRFRRTMFDRQRKLARNALAKVGEWLEGTDPKTWTPRDAATMLRVAAQLEQAANGGMEIATTDGEEIAAEPQLRDIMQIPADLEADMARLLHRAVPRVELPVEA
jgi:hypothetical protein